MMKTTERFTRDELLDELLRQVARGQETAFAELYDRTCHMVYGLVLRLIREHSAAEDMVQEIYFQVWQKAKGFDYTRGRVISWILTIARNRALDKLRSSGARFEHSSAEELVNLQSPVPSPEDCSSASQRAQLVRRTIYLLPPEQRRCILMAFCQGLTQTEIAGQTAIPLGTVKTRIRRGLMRLHEELSTLAPESRFSH